MKQSKQFLSVEQQIEKLKEKGIIINYDIDKITSVLERENYYRIINGYKDIFLDKEKSTPGNDVFIPGTNISDFISLYYFDVFLRSFYLDNILVVENHIKTAIAYEFSKEYGSNHNEYMNPNNFQEKVKCENGYKKYNTLKNNIDNVLKNKWSLKNEPYISHYQKTYTGIPLWVLINSCSFGVTYEIFQFLKDSVKNKIAKHFNMSFSSLDRSISFLCYYRNICAHNNRFFCAKKREKIKSNSKLIDSYAYYGIPKIKGKSQYAYGLNDVFALTNIILYLSAPLQRTIFVLGFTAITEHYSKKFINISMDEILYKMGFFKEWKEKLLVPYPINEKVDFNWNFKLTPVSKL